MTAVLVVVLMTLALGLLWSVAVQALRDEQEPMAPLPPAPVRRPVRASVPHVLYYYVYASAARAGQVYIGISNDPEARHWRHLSDPRDEWWMRQSTGVMHYAQWFPNRATALAAERRAIRAAAYAGEPIANQVHHPAGRIRRAIH